MHSLRYVGGVNEIVVRVVVLAVPLLQPYQKILQYLYVDLEFPDEIVALQKFVSDVFEGVAIGGSVDGKKRRTSNRQCP